MPTVLWIVLAAVVLGAVWVAFAYNGVVGARNRAQSSWSQVEVELKRRRDLVPELVESVSGYALHERVTLDEVASARSASERAAGPAEATPPGETLGAGAGRLLAAGGGNPRVR